MTSDERFAERLGGEDGGDERHSPDVADRVRVAADGASYWLDLPARESDYIQGWVAEHGEPYEHAMLRDMASRLSEDDVVVDVGANVGNHTLYLAAAARCRVHAFEPDDALASAIEVSARLNDLQDRVRVHHRALGATSGAGVLMRPDPSNLGSQHMELDGVGPVEVVPLDAAGVDRPVRAMKIDVEGMELDVLEGSATVIAEDRPLLYVECRDEAAFGSVAAWLDERGYVYWETFNATPTLLFRPQESVEPDQVARRLLLKTVRDSFRTAEVIRGLRGRLDDANLKYRTATQNHRLLRERHDAAEKRLAQLHEELGTARSALAQRTADADARVAASRAAAEVAAERSRLVAERAEAALVEVTAERDRLVRELQGLTRERQEQAHQLDRLRAESAAVGREVERLRGELERARAAATAARTEAAVREQAMTRTEQHLARAAERPAQLEEAARVRAEEVERISRDSAARLEVLAGGYAELAARVLSLSAGLESAWGEAAALTAELGGSRAREDGFAAQFQALTADRDAALAREKAAVAKAAAADARARAAERTLRELRSSVTFRTGKEVRAARTSPRAALVLPARLWRLSREKPVASAARAEPTESVAAARQPADAGARPSVAHGTVAPRVRIAAIVDEFTALSLEPECDLVHLTPDGWRDELGVGRPDLLFVESAWRGRDGAWHNTVPQLPEDLRQIVAWCRDRGIPTAFWNKEDPVHFTTFLTTAREFDHVFTTDIDCVPRYKASLGHERVHLLPFATQPRLHHPIEDKPRRDGFSFAGAYYRRYPDRTRDLDDFLEHLPEHRPVEIYDRNFGGTDENYMFPEPYQKFIVGTLPAERIAEAYKGYRFGINLNSVKQSQSMFARRVFELLSSNTVTVSNFSRGLRLMFGDLVVSTDSGAEAVRRLRELDEDRDHIDRVRLAALRAVMSQHTYADRLAYVLLMAAGRAVPDALPGVVAFGRARDQAEVERLLAAVQRQEGVRCRLVLVLDDEGLRGAVPEGVMTLRSRAATDVLARDLVGDAEVAAFLHPDDYHGPHYLLDLLLGTRYTSADVLGKRTRFRVSGGRPELCDVGAEYRRAGRLPIRTSVARPAGLMRRTVGDLLANLDTGLHEAADQVALDRFGYCQGGALTGGVAEAVDDVALWTGISLPSLQALAEGLEAAPGPGDDQRAVAAEQLAEWFGAAKRRHIVQQLDGENWRIDSTLPDGAHDYVYAPRTVPVADLWPDGRAKLYVDALPGLGLQFVVLFLDADGERLGTMWALPQQNSSAEVPEGAAVAKIGVRVRGPGVGAVRSLILEEVRTEPVRIVSTSQDTVLTNHYPSYDNLYRNGFVHSRLRAYREYGVRPEVFRLRPGQALEFSEFEGVDVVTGSAEALEKLLEHRRPRAVLVHFLDEGMWNALATLDERVRVVVWIHGAEVQPWWRRTYNYRDDTELEAAKAASDTRLAFWRRVFGEAGAHVHFVFVSHYFADEVMEDVGVQLDAATFSIVHNPIDTAIFKFHEKDVRQRLKILSIRPFASRKYANDLTVAAIEDLRQEPWFEELEFRIVGDGALFDEVLAPVRGLANVLIERRFLTQQEIAQLHSQYGVFLVPTRMDAQGVSRDEAMASGLVPLSNAVAAVPEFVDEESGVLVPPDDSHGLADAIRRLRSDPDLFSRLSKAAARRVRSQSANEVIIGQELSLFVGSRSLSRSPSGDALPVPITVPGR